MNTHPIVLSAVQEFLIYCDTHRDVTYREVEEIAHEHGVKTETLTRRTRQDLTKQFPTHGLSFKKYNADGKLIKGSEPWVTMKTIGRLRTSTILNV